MNDERLSVTDVRQKGEDLKLIDELQCGVVVTLDSESNERTELTAIESSLCPLVVDVGWQARIVHPGHFRMLF